MNSRLLRSILQLYALLAGKDGLLEAEKSRIAQFLGNHLSGKDIEKALSQLEEYVQELTSLEGSQEALDKFLSNICRSINQEFLLWQKYYLFLELFELSGIDGMVSEEEHQILSQIPAKLFLAAEDVVELEKFASGYVETDFEGSHFLKLGQGIKSQPESIPDLEGLVVVLKLPSIENYFVRVLGHEETYLNGQLMIPGMSRIWAPGTTLRQTRKDPVYFNTIQEKFSAPINRVQISFEARDIEFRFRDGRVGLQKTSLSEKGGRLVAIMGGSGCGKSTLFNVLNGNENPQKGHVLINGVDVHRDPVKLEGVIGYVPQDDLLNERLTVYQNLIFAARFSFGSMPEPDIAQLAEKTLQSLGLWEVRDKEVGSPAKKTISGGQRKRLNIGLELIREPSVLFVDEPTSGLSSSDSLRTMELLKNLALAGKLVFVIIHQPSASIFRMFDRLLVMDQGGHSVYYGHPLEAIAYFRKEAALPPAQSADEAANSAQIFDIIETKLVSETGVLTEQRKFLPQDWAKRFKARFQHKEVEKITDDVPHYIQKPGFFRQIRLYFLRDILAKYRDQQYMLINLLEAPVLAMLLAVAVRYAPTQDFVDKPYRFSANENIPAYFFMSVIVALFMGLSVSAEEIIRDRLLLKREKFLHLNRDSYLIAKILLLFTLSALHTLAFVWISDTVLEVNDIGWEFWAVLFSTSCCANLLGLVLSDTFKNAVVVYILIPLLLIPQLVLGGVVIQYDKLNPWFGEPGKVPLVGDVMISRWAYEALMVSQYKNNPYQSVIFETEARREEYQYKRNFYLKKLRDLKDEVSVSRTRKTTSVSPVLLKIKKKLLKKEPIKESAKFGIPATQWAFLDGPGLLNTTQMETVEGRLNTFKSYYNRKYQEEDRKLNAIFRQHEDQKMHQNRLLELQPFAENERVSQIVAGEMQLQQKIELSEEGIYRKVKPVYQYPEPDHLLDFRAHFYAPVKFFAGKFFPTEYFNIAIIWVFSLATVLALKFRLLRRLFGFSV